MREVFDDDELSSVDQEHDTEVTLGPMMVTGLLFALLLLCGLCFGLGYSLGSRGAKGALTAGQATASSATGAAGVSASKPGSATPKMATAQAAATDAATSGASGSNSATAQSVESGAAQSAAVTGSIPASPLMVQVATVSNQEDADVLVSALHRRGYAVAISQDGSGGQFHVSVGPFASINEANSMRQKLLNDGYNAVVQP